MNQLMDDEFEIVSPHTISPSKGNNSSLVSGSLVVSFSCIVEILPPTTKVAFLDYNEVEWIVPKRKPRGGNRVDVGSTMRMEKPPIRNLH